MKTFLICILLTLLPATWVNANQLGQTFTLNSKHLNEERKIVVSLPSNYQDEPFFKFPVLYLTDANSQFDHTASMIHYLSGGISPMIVVGIFTPNRLEELVPYQSGGELNSKSENLRKFIVEEVKPYINQNYRTVDYSMFAGHSLGGSFATNAYIKGPDDFDVFFALAPNFAMGNEVMFDLLPESFAKSSQPKVYFLFEGITPFPTPIKSYHTLSSMLLDYKHLKDSHKVLLFEDEDHLSITHIGMYRALNEIYQGWFLYIPQILENDNAFEKHFKGLSERIGYTVTPTEFYFWDLVSALIQLQHIETAETIANLAQKAYPESHFSYVLLANVARDKKDSISEANFLKQAIKLSTHDLERNQRYKKRLIALGEN